MRNNWWIVIQYWKQLWIIGESPGFNFVEVEKEKKLLWKQPKLHSDSSTRFTSFWLICWFFFYYVSLDFKVSHRGCWTRYLAASIELLIITSRRCFCFLKLVFSFPCELLLTRLMIARQRAGEISVRHSTTSHVRRGLTRHNCYKKNHTANCAPIILSRATHMSQTADPMRWW